MYITIRKGSILNNIALVLHLCFNSALWSGNWTELQFKCFDNLLKLSNPWMYRFCSIFKKHWLRHRDSGKYLKSNGMKNSAWLSVMLQQQSLIWTFNMKNDEKDKKRVQRIPLRQILESCTQSRISALKAKIAKDIRTLRVPNLTQSWGVGGGWGTTSPHKGRMQAWGCVQHTTIGPLFIMCVCKFASLKTTLTLFFSI